MKKLSLLIALLLVAMGVFAKDYVVESVTGKVQYEATPGTWKNVSVGQKIASSTVVSTSLNSNVVLSSDGSKVTVKALQKGTLDSLVASASKGKSVKRGPIDSSEVAAKSSGSTKGVATASSRASEAKEDVEWEEE